MYRNFCPRQHVFVFRQQLRLNWRSRFVITYSNEDAEDLRETLLTVKMSKSLLLLNSLLRDVSDIILE